MGLFELMLPRHLEIIYEINHRFLDEVRTRFPGDDARAERMSLIEEVPVKQVRMAHLAIVGSHSTNGVAAIHSELLRTTVVKDFADMFPERFNNKTNGVTPRRWLLLANPDSPTDYRSHRRWLADRSVPAPRPRPLPTTPPFAAFRQAKRAAKLRFADWLRVGAGKRLTRTRSSIARLNVSTSINANCSTSCTSSCSTTACARPTAGGTAAHLFLRRQGGTCLSPGQAHHQADQRRRCVIDADRAVQSRLKVLFLPEYNVSLAERLIPASDVSEQISTAGYEASGTSNMKFMMKVR